MRRRPSGPNPDAQKYFGVTPCAPRPGAIPQKRPLENYPIQSWLIGGEAPVIGRVPGAVREMGTLYCYRLAFAKN